MPLINWKDPEAKREYDRQKAKERQLANPAAMLEARIKYRASAKWRRLSARYRKQYRKNTGEARAARIKWQAANPDRHLQGQIKKYGMSVSDFKHLLFKQGGVCAICRGLSASGKRLAIDHIHGSAPILVRGLLCQTCNQAIGFLKDCPDLCRRAESYLLEFNPWPGPEI